MNRLLPIFLCTAAAAALAACGGSDRQEITETRSVPSPEAEQVDTATQLGMPQFSREGQQTPPVTAPRPEGAAPMAGPLALGYDLPAGWEVREPRPMRDINLGVAGAPDTECFVTVIPGDGGGVEMNINRWASQVGQPDLDPEAIAALPRIEMLGVEAVLVDLEGTFTGMRGEVNIPGAVVLGAVAMLEEHGVFVKMTGPAETVRAHEEAFQAFSASLRIEDGTLATPTAPVAEDDAAYDAASPAAQADVPFDPARLAWTAPEGWVQADDRPMREVTYTVADSPETECYVTVLSGDGGGMAANLNRWRAQMGDRTPFTTDEINAMPTIPMLGGEARLIALDGDFTGMTGPTMQGFSLRGAVVLLGSHAVFVRITGPAEIIEREHDNFLAFCESLTQVP